MHKKTVFNTNCCVFNCHSRKNVNRTIHFHYFPKKHAGFVYIPNNCGVLEKIDRRKAWEKALLMGKPVTAAMRVCSLHFKPDDYKTRGSISPRLKCTAVPSLNLPKKRSLPYVQKASSAKSHPRLERLERRNILREINKEPKSVTDENLCESMDIEPDVNITEQAISVVTLQDLNEDELICIESLLKLGTVGTPTASKSTQVTSGDFSVCFTSLIKEDTQLNSLTGIFSLRLLNTLTHLMNKFYADKKQTKMSVKDRIILVFMRLKMAIRFRVLAFLFKMSEARVRTIFNIYVSHLANILRSQIRWPASEEIKTNMPQCFENFDSVRIIIDCTEIPLQRPKCLCCRIRTYSHYKGGHTLKLMVGVSPGGLITFVSKFYGGRSSDKAIFEQSGLVNKLERNDSIMVDKGFLIDELCRHHQIKLIHPHFLRNKKQFTPEEATTNVQISRARVHIERINQRIKVFEIFKRPFPWSLVNMIDDIFLIICALVNLQPPILADDKFC